MSEQKIALGRQLAVRRRQLGWTIRDLALRIGRQPSRVSETETGKANSTIDSLAEIASAMRMRIMLIPEGSVDQVLKLIDPQSFAAMGSTKTTPGSAFDDVFIPDPEETDDRS